MNSNRTSPLLTNIFSCIKNPIVQSITDIPSVLKEIKQGKYKDKIIESRTYGKGHPIFERNKCEIPTFTPNGTFTVKRSLDTIESLSGLIYLDIDHLIDINQLNDLPFVYSYWKSFSGNGYGVLVPISGLTQDNFKSSWVFLENYFSQMNIKIDPHSKDISRQCVISFDPEIFINTDLTQLKVPDINIDRLYPVKMTLPDYLSDRTYNERISYQTTLDDYQDQDFVIIEDGKEHRNTFVPRVIEEGQRHYWLFSYINSILFNNPSITQERLGMILYKINMEHCQPRLPDKEVYSIVNWSFSKHINKQLVIRTKKKRYG